MSADKAAADMKYLLNRGYNRNTSLNLVVNRYHLDPNERNILRRYVFSEHEIRAHKSKLITPDKIKGNTLVVDGFNVLITVESINENKNLVLGMDSILRDSSGVFSNYRFDSKTKKALKQITDFLKKHNPGKVLFIFDSQISKSGQLAAYVRKKLDEAGVSGDAKTSKNADQQIININEITASSDSHIIESVDEIVDIPGHINTMFLFD